MRRQAVEALAVIDAQRPWPQRLDDGEESVRERAAPFTLIKAAIPYMYAQKWGRIVNIASALGLRGAVQA